MRRLAEAQSEHWKYAMVAMIANLFLIPVVALTLGWGWAGALLLGGAAVESTVLRLLTSRAYGDKANRRMVVSALVLTVVPAVMWILLALALMLAVVVRNSVA